MPVIAWSDTYSVGIKKIDEQHASLLNMMNTLYEAMKAGKGRAVLSDIFTELKDYTVNHFFMEEKLMVVYVYPEFDMHKAEHMSFVNQVKEFEKAFASNTNNQVSIELVHFLRDWLVNHISETDKRLGKFLVEKEME